MATTSLPILPHVKKVAKKSVIGLIAGVNNRFSSSAGGENRPAFYDIDKDLPLASAFGSKLLHHPRRNGGRSQLQGSNPALP